MSKAYKCDRCRKVHDKKDGTLKMEVRHDYWPASLPYRFRLCSTCANELGRWFKFEEVDE